MAVDAPVTVLPVGRDRKNQAIVALAVRTASSAVTRSVFVGVAKMNSGELAVWGTTRGIPALCLVLEVTAPGLLVIKHHRGDESRPA